MEQFRSSFSLPTQFTLLICVVPTPIPNAAPLVATAELPANGMKYNWSKLPNYMYVKYYEFIDLPLTVYRGTFMSLIMAST